MTARGSGRGAATVPASGRVWDVPVPRSGLALRGRRRPSRKGRLLRCGLAGEDSTARSTDPDGPKGSLLGDVPPFTGDRVEPDAHAEARRRVLEALFRGAEAVFQWGAARLTAARAGAVSRRLRLVRAIAHALDDGRDDEGQSDEQRI